MNSLTVEQAQLMKRALQQFKYEDPNEHADVLELMDLVEHFLWRIAETDTLFLWSDGAVRPTNPGPAGIGVVGKVGLVTVFEVSKYIGRSTNNVAEFKAAIEALRWAVDFGAKRVVLHCDSRLVVEQFYGRWDCKKDTLIPLIGRLRDLSQRFESCILEWIPREQNREADGLSVAGAHPPRKE